MGFGREQERKGVNNIEEELRGGEKRRQFKSKRIERERVRNRMEGRWGGGERL